MQKTTYLAGALVALLAMPALAQTPVVGTPTRIRGTVDSLDGQTLKVKERNGSDVSIALAPNSAVTSVERKTRADITDNSFIGITSVKGKDGKLEAKEVHIFPENRRGAGEGQRPWDLMPGSLMTNATVTGMVTSGAGETVTVTYKGGQTQTTIGPDTQIVGFVPGDASLLKPGATVFVSALKKPDGTLSASRVTVGKDGVNPPM